ncbi:isochorismatase family protein [Paramicrobacterium agarici]|uniref:isochorismatase family protein n=1 Tax=Paramicrobacterium agarici TaxID=630514 RepID=UPI001153DA4E|nr:isochorismatase family protein [Microbacterium agarici]TQO22301.1 nicotinamidase-related amidase [Microbacterium agarici]
MADAHAAHGFHNEELVKQYEKVGFGGKVGFGERPAVLVIDLAKAWTDSESPLGSDLSGPIAETARILKEARAKGLPIFFTTMAFEPDFSDLGDNVLRKKPVSSVQVKGTEWVEIVPELDRQPDEVLINKPRASSFYATNLHGLLQGKNVDTLIITGCSTSGCVRATSQTSHDHNIRTIVPRQAVGDRSKTAHDAALFDINARMADVVDVEEVLDYIKAL